MKRIRESITGITGRTVDDCVALVECGVPDAVALAKAEELESDLLVVPGHWKVNRLVRHAHCPVLVVRGENSAGCIVGATDLSDTSVPAITAAGEEAAVQGRHLLAVFSLDLAGLAMTPADSPTPSQVFSQTDIDDITRCARQQLRAVLQGAKTKGLPLVQNGPPAAAILQTVDEFGAGLVVIGATGRSGVPRMLLGSVAEAVVEKASCSVLAVRLNSKTKGGANASQLSETHWISNSR